MCNSNLYNIGPIWAQMEQYGQWGFIKLTPISWDWSIIVGVIYMLYSSILPVVFLVLTFQWKSSFKVLNAHVIDWLTCAKLLWVHIHISFWQVHIFVLYGSLQKCVIMSIRWPSWKTPTNDNKPSQLFTLIGSGPLG